MTETEEVMVGRTDWRYARTEVTRYVLNKKHRPPWIEVEHFTDAKVQATGEDGYTDAPQAMIRAYSPNVEFYGDEDYRNGNGIWVCDKEGTKHYGEDYVGLVLDCDGDLALRRILGTVLSHRSFGDGDDNYTVLTNRTPERNRGDEKFEWDGWGWSDEYRIEQWQVRFHKEEHDES